MVRLQSMRQCSVVHNAGLRGPGWDGNSFSAFTLIVCKMQASITRSPAATCACVCSAANESRLGILLCAKRGGPMPRRGLLHVAIVIASQLCSLGAKFTSALNIPSAVRVRESDTFWSASWNGCTAVEGKNSAPLTPPHREPLVLFSFTRPLPS